MQSRRCFSFFTAAAVHSKKDPEKVERRSRAILSDLKSRNLLSTMRSILLVGLVASANAFVVTAPLAPMSAQCTRSSSTEMMLGYKLAAGAATATVVGVGYVVKKKIDSRPKKDSPDVAALRASLGSMDSLSGLSEMKLEREEGKESRVAGVWKECACRPQRASNPRRRSLRHSPPARRLPADSLVLPRCACLADVKNDGRKWYYNTDTKKMTWMQPEEFAKLDEIAAAAKAANEARGA